MKEIYQDIVSRKGQKQLAILIDPDNENLSDLASKVFQIHKTEATHIFVGGSTDVFNKTDQVVKEIKKHSHLPVIIFPGDINQISSSADAILFLSLISGRNPDYLIEKQVQAVPEVLASGLEVISTGYILIEGGAQSSVERVSKTKPIPYNQIDTIVNTAKAGELMGMKLIYLEAGSGALWPVSQAVISAVADAIDIPLIVGGGIKQIEQLQEARSAGADVVVVGTAFEINQQLFELNHNQIIIKK